MENTHTPPCLALTNRVQNDRPSRIRETSYTIGRSASAEWERDCWRQSSDSLISPWSLALSDWRERFPYRYYILKLSISTLFFYAFEENKVQEKRWYPDRGNCCAMSGRVIPRTLLPGLPLGLDRPPDHNLSHSIKYTLNFYSRSGYVSWDHFHVSKDSISYWNSSLMVNEWLIFHFSAHTNKLKISSI